MMTTDNPVSDPPTDDSALTRITLVQLTDSRDGVAALARMPTFFAAARAQGSDLIVFPEYCLGRQIRRDDACVQRFQALAAEYQIHAVAGLIEARDERWCTTALLVDPAGEIVGDYLKVHPACGPAPHCWPPVAGEDAEARGILGSAFCRFDLPFGRVGILQCYDGYFPEAWACTAHLGAEIILWINGRSSMVQDAYCITAAHAHGCVVAACVSDGWNTGFAAPKVDCLIAPGSPEETRLHPRIPEPGDACVHAAIDMPRLRWHRKHLRTMHQRRPELYTALTQDLEAWRDYPAIPWDFPECADLVNRSQLEPS